VLAVGRLPPPQPPTATAAAANGTAMTAPGRVTTSASPSRSPTMHPRRAPAARPSRRAARTQDFDGPADDCAGGPRRTWGLWARLPRTNGSEAGPSVARDAASAGETLVDCARSSVNMPRQTSTRDGAWGQAHFVRERVPAALERRGPGGVSCRSWAKCPAASTAEGGGYRDAGAVLFAGGLGGPPRPRPRSARMPRGRRGFTPGPAHSPGRSPRHSLRLFRERQVLVHAGDVQDAGDGRVRRDDREREAVAPSAFGVPDEQIDPAGVDEREAA
jgi:hypothetical protein